MREAFIERGVQLAKTNQSKNISMEETKRFLQSKLSEEEIAEVMKRLQTGETDSGPTARLDQANTQFQPMQDAMAYARQVPLPQQPGGSGGNGGHSLMTIAAVAVLSALGLTYVLDNYKDKKDRQMKEDLEHRVDNRLKRTEDTIRELEVKALSLKTNMLSQDKVEQIVSNKIAEHQRQAKVEESKKQAINLKIKQSKNLVRRDSSVLDSEPEDRQKRLDDMEQLRLDILKEMRENNAVMKDSIADLASSFKKTVASLKKGEAIEVESEKGEEEKKPDPEKGFGDFILGGAKTESDPFKQFEPKQTSAEKKKEEEKKSEEEQEQLKQHPELTEEQKTYLQERVTQFLEKFASSSAKAEAIRRLKVPFNMISMVNSDSMAENMKTIQMQNQQFKNIKENNEYFIQFLLDIGFTKIEGDDAEHADAKFKYIPDEKKEEAAGEQASTAEAAPETSTEEPSAAPLVITKGNKKNLGFVLTILK